jgi:transitional endoplasmic reticulum ATPase
MDSGALTIDRRLPDPGEVRGVLDATDKVWCEGHDQVTSLVRLLYPVFRIRYSYEVEGTFPWSAGETEHDACLVDGLQTETSEALQQYVDSAFDPATVYPDKRYGDESVETQLLEFQATNGQVTAALESNLGAEANGLNPDDSALPAMIPPTDTLAVFEGEDRSFGSIESVSRLYLPFWLVQLDSDEHDYPCYLSARDVGGSDSPVDAHPWLATFATEHPELLTEYRRENWLDSPQDTGSATAVEHQDRDPVEPEDSAVRVDDVLDPNPQRSFDDVAGMADLKRRLEHRVVDPYRNPEQFEDYGLGTVDGVLLHGPPGCGKTYISGALAGELDHEFVRVTPADLTSRYMGEPAQKVADLFEIARLNQPCLVFIDEIDALAGERNDDMNTSERQLVNQLLTELESIADEDVMVLAATNRIEDVDSAIRRSGRFDERIEVPPPDAEARRKMLELHLSGRPTGDIDLTPIVDETAGFAASDVALLVESAARNALRDDREITADHLQAALDDTETSIAGWTDRYPALFDEVEDYETVTQPEGVEMNADTVLEPNPGRDFDDVGGLADLQTTLEQTVIEPLANADAYAEYDLDVIDGVLLYGPPGCGKTYLAGALAGELGYHFLPIQPADIVSKWMGQPAQNVADLFAIARANQPCLVFLDEIDAIAGERGSGMNTSERQLVNQLLAELDAVSDEEVVVVAATNLIDDVDSAIRRSGRFDERIEVPPPDAEARREILAIHLRNRPTAADIDWGPAVDATAGYAASDLALVAEDAARRAFRADESVDGSHLEAAASEAKSSLHAWENRDRYEADDTTSDLRYLG